ncbi:MAG: sulfatase-like hydrolase/transferase [Planctomycetaceae bacterium]|nr:sulfatase-like hydrolase/transferase [Planctomycetales bacterium]MCB9922203.1 sulfatase-like hydrolase/transferase [Planctomycetaceae bacterium]
MNALRPTLFCFARVACLAVAYAVSLTSSAAEKRPPNILLIITDQQHAEMMSCADNKFLNTPAIDSLARDGIRFANAYVTNPVCVPSRISMATGVMAGRLGVLNNGDKARVPPEVDNNSLGKLVKRAGYKTFYGGKVHMCRELNPLDAGYDEYFADQREALPGACIDFIERNRDGPFFAVASFINPHDICFAYSAYKGKSVKGKQSVDHLYKQASELPPEQLPPLPDNFRIPQLEPEAIELYSRANAVTPAGTMRKVYDERQWQIYRWIYCRLTEQVDEHIGRILDALKRNGLDEETLVIFTSDHGDMDACHRLASKGKFYEQSVRVPFLMRYKGKVVHRVDTNLISSGLDLLPTVCDYAGLEVPQGLMGKSLRPLAESQDVAHWRDYIVTENHTGRMLRSVDYKYCVYREGDLRESLVNMRDDPGEMTNLASKPEHTDTLNEHRRYLKQWITSSGDQDAESFAIAARPKGN